MPVPELEPPLVQRLIFQLLNNLPPVIEVLNGPVMLEIHPMVLTDQEFQGGL